MDQDIFTIPDADMSDAQIIERGNMARAFLDSVFWKGYLEPKLARWKQSVIDELTQHPVSGGTQDNFEFVRFQQVLHDIGTFRRGIQRDIEYGAQAFAAAQHPEGNGGFSKVGLRVPGENG